MRTKEIEQALELLEKIKISESMNVYIGVKDIKKANTLIQYIEGLEELPNKIREKMKELEKDIEESKRMIENATKKDEKIWWQEELIKLVTGEVYLKELLGE